MATARKYWRKIEVDSCAYRWMVGKQEYYYQSGYPGDVRHTIMVENVETGALLGIISSPSDVSSMTQAPSLPVVPSAVARYIRQAKAEGWTEQKQSQPFSIVESENKQLA